MNKEKYVLTIILWALSIIIMLQIIETKWIINTIFYGSFILLFLILPIYHILKKDNSDSEQSENTSSEYRGK